MGGDLLSRLKELEGRPASEFLQHREPMLLLDKVEFLDRDSAVCSWKVRGENGFLQVGIGVPSYVGVEYMAQCIAVHAGAIARTKGDAPPVGFLLGSRDYVASVAFFDVGREYQVKCHQLMRSEDGMGSFECEILRGKQSLAKARLAVLEGNSELVMNV